MNRVIKVISANRVKQVYILLWMVIKVITANRVKQVYILLWMALIWVIFDHSLFGVFRGIGLLELFVS
jgi:hypothetical protein